MINHINNLILRQASKLKYRVADEAPGTIPDLFQTSGTGQGLVIWSGASDNTIFQDASVNWAFRALHDALHVKTRIGFSPAEEIELGRIQASQYNGIMADLVYIEVAGQAEYFLKNGVFVQNQVEFTVNALKQMGYKIDKCPDFSRKEAL